MPPAVVNFLFEQPEKEATLAEYKYSQLLSQANKPAYDSGFSPGTKTLYSGIYRCTKCGLEDTCVAGYPFPPQNHHQRTAVQGPIVWQLIVAHARIKQ
jgi:hypothetical protein